MTQEKEISAAFPFESKFVEVLGSKMHYVEEGSGDPILFLHGNPTSSYLWRNVIPQLSSIGRCIAPDLIGMGKSDKPDIGYRFVDPAKYVDGFIEALDLKNITFVVHDWGCALGFHYATRNESNVKGIAFMEGLVRPLTWDEWPEQAKQIFEGFRTQGAGETMILENNMFVEQVLPGSVLRTLSEEEMAVYREPYTTKESRLPTLQWPREIPLDGEPADVVKITTESSAWAGKSETPKLLLHFEPGAIMRNLVGWCEENYKNLKTVAGGAGVHFVQEDQPETIGKEIAAWMRETGQG
jgi:haloalkane dehalogenase